MISCTNFSDMTISGWGLKYSKILKEFNYDKKADFKSAKLLNSVIKSKTTIALKKIIHGKYIFVIAAGPSLSSAIPFLKKFDVVKIVADGAAQALIENKIKPEIVVTDLDGDEKTLKKIGKTNTILVVHAHGDNSEKLKLASKFKKCIGTTQTKPFSKIHNFGGFTDGDRCVFLANHFKAKTIILFGMDFGTRIGKYSKKRVLKRNIKIKKLKRGEKLLEWLATKSNCTLYTTSKPIRGFKKISYKDLEDIIIT